MSLSSGAPAQPEPQVEPEIKRVPASAAMRDALRRSGQSAGAGLQRTRPPGRDVLVEAARGVLAESGAPSEHLGYAMVAVDNGFWAAAFAGTPFERRLLLLPKCLSASGVCKGQYDSVGLTCANCGACVIPDLTAQAEALGYSVIVAEGTSSVLMKVMEGGADAVLGVACLDSLDRSFERISELGIPHQAVPLLRDGCCDTEAELDVVQLMLHATGPGARGVEHSYLPLLRETRRVFDPQGLQRVLEPVRCGAPGGAAALGATCSIALDWLRRGGKRLRPFLTVAAYAVARHGIEALGEDDAAPLVPDEVRALAVAIEAFHKASLVHDDIEDGDSFRYGESTVHAEHGIPVAINVGDYLIGLGYQLIGAQAPGLGVGAVADVLARMSQAHLKLCSGQGADLLWARDGNAALRPIDALQIGALKTAPAFEVALYAGLRAARDEVASEPLGRYAAYIGQAYQVMNDLDDWDDETGKLAVGLDALHSRPTVLQAFAMEAGASEEIARATALTEAPVEEIGALVIDIYRRTGALEKARTLYLRLRERSLDAAAEMGDPALEDLMGFLTRTILPARVGDEP